MGDPHVVLDLGHILLGCGLFRKRPRQHELRFEYGFSSLYNPIIPSKVAASQGIAECLTRRCMSRTFRPVLRSYYVLLRSSVAAPSCTMRLPDKSSGSASPRFSRQRCTRAASSLAMIIRASEPPMKDRLSK